MLFKFTKSEKFKEALDKTFDHFEQMSDEELISLGEKHSTGEIADFLKYSQDGSNE